MEKPKIIIRLGKTERRALEMLAANDGCTLSEEIRRLIRSGFDMRGFKPDQNLDSISYAMRVEAASASFDVDHDTEIEKAKMPA